LILILMAKAALLGLRFVKDQSETFFVIHSEVEVRMNDEEGGSRDQDRWPQKPSPQLPEDGSQPMPKLRRH